ncbi:MAG: polysaccharide biosynthesis/export family protein [Pirellulaceae bacterium]
MAMQSRFFTCSTLNLCRLGMLLSLLSLGSGCITFAKNAIPAYRLPSQFEAPTKCNLNPVNFALLGTANAEHRLGHGDRISITIQGVIPAAKNELPPIIAGQATLAREYYPPNGAVDAPSVGLPIQVQKGGVIQLPLVPTINVDGLTVSEAAEQIRQQYVAEEIIREGNDQVTVSLLRSRVNRVTILREDASTEAANTIQRGQAILHKRGSANVIDLPVYESDLLHALAISGGLPGVDAYNEVWILRRQQLQEGDSVQIRGLVEEGYSPSDAIVKVATHVDAIRIPLKLCPDEPIPFTDEDVRLHDGDVVYIEPRRDEYFYTGGLLGGRQIPMPRDEDLDVLEALALAEGSVGGLGGTSSVSVLRAGAGLGNIIPPTRVVVIRKLPNGQQLQIRVDLNEAKKNPQERLRIMAGDFVMMYYKPGEMLGNAALNFFNVNYTIR